MTHDEFTAGAARGAYQIDFEPKAAAKYLSIRLMLPLVALPVLGIGVALALIGWIYTGLAILAVGFVLPRLIKRAAPRILYELALQDPALYDDLTRSGLMQVRPRGEAAKSEVESRESKP